MTNTSKELRELYRRCDISNNRTDNPVSEDEFVALITQQLNTAVVEARIDEDDKILQNADDLLCHGLSVQTVLRSINGRKRELEGELTTLKQQLRDGK